MQSYMFTRLNLNLKYYFEITNSSGTAMTTTPTTTSSNNNK